MQGKSITIYDYQEIDGLILFFDENGQGIINTESSNPIAKIKYCLPVVAVIKENGDIWFKFF